MFRSSLNLEILRGRALNLILAMVGVQPVLVAIACWACGAPILAPALSALLIAVGAFVTARWDRGGDLARLVAGVALMASISILVGTFAGQKVQVDLHMYYFAALALLVATCDWKVIVAGAATVAVHHIILNFLIPSLIYPGGSDIFRLALHAVILLLEAGVLIWLARTLEQMFTLVRAQVERAEANQLVAEKNGLAAQEAAARADQAHLSQEQERRQVARDDEATLHSLASALEHLAHGDLTYRIATPLPAKSEALRRDFNAAIEKMERAMLAVSTSAEGIGAGATDISSATNNLSRRTEQQASGLADGATALGEITTAVRNTADRVSYARNVVCSATDVAAHSAEIVSQAVKAMNGIETSAGEIGQIIGVIDEIAFQTNLLALNAGVEAARAGDAGKGFAVVASEVRALAQRSAQAAKEIKALISTSTQHVAAGVQYVGKTGDTLEAIARKVSELDGLVADIAAAAQDQMLGLNQVNATINHMDQVTQQNAAMVEQTSAACQNLTAETRTLAQLLATFKCRDDGRQTKAPNETWAKRLAS
jgi:methyl-accepting chemotaxis protein